MDWSARWAWSTLILLGVFVALLSVALAPFAHVRFALPLVGDPTAGSLLQLLGLLLCGLGTLGIGADATEATRTPAPAGPQPDSLTLGWDADGQWIRLSNDAQQRHTLIVGSSGSGKTQLLLSLLAQQISRGGGALMIDAKVDRSAFQSVIRLCRQANRLHHLRVLWPHDPTLSDTWNPLIRGSLPEVLSRIMSLWGSSGRGEADFWRGSAHTIIHAVAGALKRIDPRMTFNDLYLALTSAEALLWLEQKAEPGTEEAAALTAFLNNYRNAQGKLNIDQLKRIAGGVPQYLSAYAWGDLGQIMSAVAPSLDILQALTQGQIVYIALPILARTEEATAMARMLVSDLKQAVGELQQRSDKPQIPFLVLMDEASAYTNVDGIERLFEQARSAGVALVAASQVLSGFASVNKSQLDFILGNTATKVVMSLGDFPSAETIAKTIGEERALFGTESKVAQRGSSAPYISPLPTRGSKGESKARGSTERYDYTVRPEHLMQQRTGEAVVLLKDPARGVSLFSNTRTCYLQPRPDDTADVTYLPTRLAAPPGGVNLLQRFRSGRLAPQPAGPPVPRRRRIEVPTEDPA